MAITEAYTNSGSIGNIEFSLPNNAAYSSASPIVSTGVYQFFVDTGAMLSGDVYDLKVYEKVTSAGSSRQIYAATMAGRQAGPFMSSSFILMNGWDITMKWTAGAYRTIGWSIRKVA